MKKQANQTTQIYQVSLAVKGIIEKKGPCSRPVILFWLERDYQHVVAPLLSNKSLSGTVSLAIDKLDLVITKDRMSYRLPKAHEIVKEHEKYKFYDDNNVIEHDGEEHDGEHVIQNDAIKPIIKHVIMTPKITSRLNDNSLFTKVKLILLKRENGLTCKEIALAINGEEKSVLNGLTALYHFGILKREYKGNERAFIYSIKPEIKPFLSP